MHALVSRTLASLFVASIVLAGIVHASERAGDRAIENGNYRVAIEEYEEAIEREPENARVLVKLARTKTRLAENLDDEEEGIELFEEAADHARKATELAPDDPEAHLELARALGRLAQFRGILETLGIANTVKQELERTIELDPEHGAAYHALALWHHNVPWFAGGRASEVRPNFERAIELEPQNVSHRLAFGKILLEVGEPASACEQFRAALGIDAKTFVGRTEQEEARMLVAEHC